MYWPIELGRYVLESGWVTAIHGMEFISKGGVKISDICGEMNPLVFSALEEVNLVFILMMSSTVMVDIVFARFMFLHVLLEMTKPNKDILFVFFDYFDCTENIVRI